MMHKEDKINSLMEKSVQHINGCLCWYGATAGKGYGVTRWDGKMIYIHRLIYKFHFPNENIQIIRHACDTPNCWNINHLINGTTAENTEDKIQRGRHLFGARIHNSVLTDDSVQQIRCSPLNIYQLAAQYNVTPSTIHYVRAYKTWRHVA